MSSLDVIDRAERHAHRSMTRLRWKGALLLAPVGAAIGIGVASGVAIVWLVADFTGVWGVFALAAAGAVWGGRDGWRDPHQYIRFPDRDRTTNHRGNGS